MKRIMFSLTLFLVVASCLVGQDMRQNASSSLFSDQKATRVGDAVTINVVESSQASNNAETTTGRTSDISFNGQASLGTNTTPGASLGIGSKNNFDGTGSTKTTGLIKTKISAMIDSVLNNGNLHIKGSRKIVINGEEQTILIEGIVRISDIMADNSVMSYNISEAKIEFDGSGLVNDAQKPGWISRFFHWLF